MLPLKQSLVVLLLIGVHVGAYGLTVSVGKNGAGEFTSIADAIAGTGANDVIEVIDGGTYTEQVTVTNRTLVSNPQGATIVGPITITGDSSSETSITGFRIESQTDGIRFYGNGPDYSMNIGILNVTSCVFTAIADHGILLNFGNNGILNVTGSQFLNCGGNGMTLWRNCNLTATDCLFESNGLGGNGNAGIFIDGDYNNSLARTMTLTNVTFRNNLNGIKSWRRVFVIGTNVTATANYLEGISIDGLGNGSVLLLTDSNVSDNIDRGITMYRGMFAILTRTSISGNGSHGVFLEDFGTEGTFGFPPQITLDHCTVLNNGGRGLSHLAKGNVNSVLTVKDSQFTGSADNLLMARAETGKILYTLERNIFQTPNASTIPLFAYNSGAESIMAANLIDGGLVGVAISEGPFDVYNNTIVNSGAGAIVVSNNTGGHAMNIRNNIVAQAGSGIRAAGDGTGFEHVSVDYNLSYITGGGSAIDPHFTVGAHNNTTDPPSFVAGSVTVGAGDYNLGSNSAARNVGDPAYVPLGDVLGREYDPASPDLGAFTGTSSISNWSGY